MAVIVHSTQLVAPTACSLKHWRCIAHRNVFVVPCPLADGLPPLPPNPLNPPILVDTTDQSCNLWVNEYKKTFTGTPCCAVVWAVASAHVLPVEGDLHLDIDNVQFVWLYLSNQCTHACSHGIDSLGKNK